MAVFLAASSGAQANLVQNGNFAQTTYTMNNQFGTAWTQSNMQGVTGWTGNGGYNLFFFNGTATTTSANSQYTSGKEMLWGTSNFAGSSPSGHNFVALDGEQSTGVQGGISQQITGLTAGVTYSLQFTWAAGQLQSRTGATTEALQVSLGSQTFTTAVVSNPSQSFTGWMTQTFTFLANSTSELLSFVSEGTPVGGPPVALLTDVSLTRAPEPATVALMGTGVVGLVGVRLRRR